MTLVTIQDDPKPLEFNLVRIKPNRNNASAKSKSILKIPKSCKS